MYVVVVLVSQFSHVLTMSIGFGCGHTPTRNDKGVKWQKADPALGHLWPQPFSCVCLRIARRMALQCAEAKRPCRMHRQCTVNAPSMMFSWSSPEVLLLPDFSCCSLRIFVLDFVLRAQMRSGCLEGVPCTAGAKALDLSCETSFTCFDCRVSTWNRFFLEINKCFPMQFWFHISTWRTLTDKHIQTHTNAYKHTHTNT